MKKSRILSLFLAVMLVISSLPVTTFASDSYGADTAVWTAFSGDTELDVLRVDEAALTADESGDDYFYRFYNLLGDSGAKYTVPSGTFTNGGRYMMSVWLRAVPDINESHNEDSTPASADATNLPTLRFMYRSGSTYDMGCSATTEWQKFERVFIAGTSNEFSLTSHWYGAEDIATFDACGISFTPVDGNNNPTGDSFTGNGTWATKNSSDKMLTVKKSDEVFNRVVIPTTETTVTVGDKAYAQTEPVLDGLGETVVISGSDDVTLVPGKYTLVASFRLGWFDHAKVVMTSDMYHVSENNNTAVLTAYQGTDVIDELTINPDTWTDISYSFEITEPMNMSEFKFELGEVAALDYKIEAVLTEKASDEFVANDGEAVYIKAVEDCEYIHVSGRDNNNDRIAYTDTTKSWDKTKTYVLSFTARTNPYIEAATGGKVFSMIRIFGTTGYSPLLVNQFYLNTEWTQYTFEMTGFTGSLYIAGTGNGYGFAPYDIKDLTITEKGSTVNLASNTDGLLENGAGWAIGVDSDSYKTLSVTVANDSDYAAIPAASNGATTFNLTDDTALEAGTYYVRGEFTLDEAIDYNKYTTDGNVLSADGNVTTLGVTVNGEALEATAEINAEGWTEVTFTIVSDGSIAKSDIIFTASDAVALGVKNLEMTYDKAAADQAAADAVIAAIDAIGEVTLEDGEAIAAAEAAYANLTDDQKALVTNYATLTAAREAYNALVEEANSVAEVNGVKYTSLADALAADGDITLLKDITDEVAVAEVVSIIKNGFTANIVAADGFELVETETAYNVYTAITTKFDLSGVTMTLGSSLSLDFAIDTSKLTGTDNYAQMTIVYADGRSSDTVIVPQSEWTVFSGKVYTAKFTGMAAKQMNDVVTAVVYNANGQVVSNEKSDSIETYAVRMLNGSAASNKKLRAVYVDMLNYGAAAQQQFHYDEANLANRNLTEAHQAWATTTVETVDNRVKGTGYVGSTLTLAGEIQLDLVFNNKAIGTDYSDLYAVITYTDHYGNAKEFTIEGADFIKYSSSYGQISITGMAVADFRSVVNCVVYDSTGAELANAADSVESYANRNAENLGATVDTIVKFGSSSYNYFH